MSTQLIESSLLVGTCPCDGTLDGVESRLGTLTVLHEGWDVATSINLAEVLHDSANDGTRLILDWLDPPS